MTRYISVFSVNLSAFLLMSGTGMAVAQLPSRIMTLSGSLSDVGYLAASFALTFVLLQVPLGRLSDRLGFTLFLTGGYLLCGVGGLLFYMGESTGVIYLGRMLQGIGEVPAWSLAPALLSLQYPEQKGKFMGLYNASMHMGLTAGSFLGIWFNTQGLGHHAFLFLAATGFSGSILTLLLVRNPAKENSRHRQTVDAGSPMPLLAPLAHRIILLGIILYGAGYGIFITSVPAYLLTIKLFSQAGVNTFFGCFYIALALSQLLIGPLSDRMGRGHTMILGLGLAALGIASFPVLAPAGSLAMLATAGFGLGAFCISALAFLNEQAPESLKGTISGIFYFSWGVGYFSGPLVWGKIGQAGHWQVGFILLAALFAIELAACTLILSRQSKAARVK